MNSQIKICQNCKADFQIEPEDFAFYEKIKVPAPMWCADCRMQRRLSFRNERHLYRRTCDLCKENIISIFHKDSPSTVYCQKCWWSDKWDPLSYGQEIDMSKPFMVQVKEVMLKTPQVSLTNVNSVNSDYCQSTDGNKNCYLVIGGDYNEDCQYSTFNFYSRDSADLYWTFKGDTSYELVDCDGCFKVAFARYANNCRESYLLYDCHNCSNCFGCVGLRNKQYHIFNEPYSKEEYFKELEKLNIGTAPGLAAAKKRFEEVKLAHPHRFALILNSHNCQGDNIKGSKNCKNTFDAHDNLENIKDFWLGFSGPKDIQSCCHASTGSELCYESCSIVTSSNIFFSQNIWGNNLNIFYSYFLNGSKNCFGSVGLRNQEYCILNKKYSKEEYEKLVSQIIDQMNSVPYVDKQGKAYPYGEFFAPELSQFAYNETVAQELFPLTKEEAQKSGYTWHDIEKKNVTPDITIEQIPDSIQDVDDSVVGKVVQCMHKGDCNHQCTTAFKIIPEELQLYRKLNVPLPRLCPNCRHYERLAQRNPFKLWLRTCQCAGPKSENGVYVNTVTHGHGTESCSAEFETSYSPERKEIVYCEACYQQEVA